VSQRCANKKVAILPQSIQPILTAFQPMIWIANLLVMKTLQLIQLEALFSYFYILYIEITLT
jgi:hypothetical protein